MRNLIMASAAAAALVAGCGPALAQPGGRPGGSGAPSGYGGAPGGSYAASCRNVQFSGSALTAECADGAGRYHVSTLATGACRSEISNQNGMLACVGGAATGGQLASQGPAPARQPDNRQDDNRDRRDDRAAAAVAGAVVGALVGAPPAYGPPPVYGDPRYGDPRYDPHYAQGGWGYGRRPGEWVPLRDRADWLQQRIDRARQQGRLSRREAADLQRHLNQLEGVEARYLRDGRLDRDERADLDRKFDELQARVRFESGPQDRDGYRDRDRDGGYRGGDDYRR